MTTGRFGYKKSRDGSENVDYTCRLCQKILKILQYFWELVLEVAWYAAEVSRMSAANLRNNMDDFKLSSERVVFGVVIFCIVVIVFLFIVKMFNLDLYLRFIISLAVVVAVGVDFIVQKLSKKWK